MSDIEPIFRDLFQGKTFELIILKGVTPVLFPEQPKYYVRWQEREVDFFFLPFRRT